MRFGKSVNHAGSFEFVGVAPEFDSSGLLSNENGGIRQSNVWPSSLSNLNVPL